MDLHGLGAHISDANNIFIGTFKNNNKFNGILYAEFGNIIYKFNNGKMERN